jgi:tetratricopeptide (TPR) repeat protein
MDRLRQAGQLFFQAVALHEQGRLNQAACLYEEALALAPDRSSIMRNLATAFVQSARYEDARVLCERLLQIEPENEVALLALAGAFRGLERLDEALACCDRALTVNPDSAYAHNDRGSILRALEREGDALECFNRALDIEPDFTEALNNRGNALQELNRQQEALESYRRTLEIKPDHVDALCNLGNALLRLGRQEEANTSFRRAILLRPDDASCHLRFADALSVQQCWDEAIAEYERALLLNPTSKDAQHGAALVWLFQQEFDRAWGAYECRIGLKTYRRMHFRYYPTSLALYEARARWQGPGEAKVQDVALWAEQGIGDQVLYSTLIPELISTRVSAVYEVDPRLLRAYQRAFPEVCFVPRHSVPNEGLLRTSRVLLVGSLPNLFRRSRSDFARQPSKLLSALPERVSHYRLRLAAEETSQLRVALSWRSARTDWWVKRKSASLSDFAPVLGISGTQFVDVQYGDTAAERDSVEVTTGRRLVHFNEVDYFEDLEEVLALLAACDMLITTSNATAHFAGALGKRTWLLYLADRPPLHYWAHGGTYRSLWYPSVEIVSASHLVEWAALVEHVRRRLISELTHVRLGSNGANPATFRG